MPNSFELETISLVLVIEISIRKANVGFYVCVVVLLDYRRLLSCCGESELLDANRQSGFLSDVEPSDMKLGVWNLLRVARFRNFALHFVELCVGKELDDRVVFLFLGFPLLNQRGQHV